MTYSSELKNESASNYLCKIGIKNNQSVWATNGSNEEVTFSLGKVVSITRADTGATFQAAASLAALSSGYFYQDPVTMLLSMLTSDHGGTDINIIITYELYFATKSLYAPSDPTSSGDDVFWEPLLISVPESTYSSSDNEAGILASTSGSVSIINTSKYLDEHLSNSFLKNGYVYIYHWLTETISSNVSKIFDGFISDINLNDSSVNISVLDKLSKFDDIYRPRSGHVIFNTTQYPDVDPEYENAGIRTVYGHLDNFLLVNIDYDADNAEIGTDPSVARIINRTYAVCKHYGALNDSSLDATITAKNAGLSQITVDDASGLNIGDFIQNKTTSSSAWTQITAISGNILTVSNVTIFSVSDEIRRHRVAAVYIFDKTRRKYISPTEMPTFTITNDVLKITYSDSLEDAYPSFFDPYEIQPAGSVEFKHIHPGRHLLFAKVYGEIDDSEIDSSQFSVPSPTTGVTSKWYEVLYTYLRKEVGFLESDIDVDKFISIQDDDNGGEINVGFSVPDRPTDEFISHRELLSKFMKTCLSRIYLNFENKVSTERIIKLGTSDFTIDQNDIINGSVSISYDNTDFGTASKVYYRYSDVSLIVFGSEYPYRSTSTSSNVFKYIHGYDVEKTYHAYTTHLADANIMRDRYLNYYAYPKMLLKMSLGIDFYDISVGDIVQISRDSLPGFAFVFGTRRTQKFKVNEVKRQRNIIEITVTDQIGVESSEDSVWET